MSVKGLRTWFSLGGQVHACKQPGGLLVTAASSSTCMGKSRGIPP